MSRPTDHTGLVPKSGRSAAKDFATAAFNGSIPEPNSGCWLWLGAIKHGYPIIRRSQDFKRWDILVHRAVCEERHGPLGALMARHTCDVPWCVNPDHVLPGTHSDNMADKQSRGRQARLGGALCGRRKLTQQQVSEVLATAHIRGSGRALARRFGVRPNAISDIRTGKTWAAPR
jgi:hypothetical protein